MRGSGWIAVVAVLAAASGCLVLAAASGRCGDDASGSTPAVRSRTPDPSRVRSLPRPVSFHAIDDRTGIAVVDRLLDAFERGDVPAIAEMVEYAPVPCLDHEDPSAPGLVCRGGEAARTPVPVLPGADYDGLYFLPPDWIVDTFAPILRQAVGVHSVYRTNPGDGFGIYRPGRYAVVFGLACPSRGFRLVLDDAGIVQFNFEWRCEPVPAGHEAVWPALP